MGILGSSKRPMIFSYSLRGVTGRAEHRDGRARQADSYSPSSDCVAGVALNSSPVEHTGGEHYFDMFIMAINAAVSGLGIALLPRLLIG
jgi:DNA-binding transcriptional LysR family regulator